MSTGTILFPHITQSNAFVAPQVVALQESVKQEVAIYFAEYGFQPSKEGVLYPQMIRKMEEALFEAALNYTEGNEARASRILGISRGTLRQRRALFGHNEKNKKEND